MGDAMREAVERRAADRAYDWLAPKLSTSELATLNALVAHERLASDAARDAAWREAVERVREEHDAFCATMRRDDFCTCGAYENNAALDSLLSAMEGK